jgi:hypothetical protein
VEEEYDVDAVDDFAAAREARTLVVVVVVVVVVVIFASSPARCIPNAVFIHVVVILSF